MNPEEAKRMTHEAFVTGHSGSSALDIILTVFPIIGSSFVAFSITGGMVGMVNFLIEFVLCCLPMILTFTVLSGYVLEISATMLLLAMFATTFTLHKRNSKPFKETKLPFLTCIRATVNLSTVIAILAVDFHCFPRRFAKTEKFGYSLMDVGAPCFIFMNGITDKNRKGGRRSLMKDGIILCILGSIRLLSLHATNYQHHVTEYGVHGNFFFILSALKILCLLCFTKMNAPILLILSCFVAVLHEWHLSKGLAGWILSEAPRDGFFSANRESIYSFPGHLSLYLAGMAFSGYLFKFKNSVNDHLSFVFSLIVFGGFICVGISEQLLGFLPSRRLMNFTFVLWIVSFFVLFLLWFKVVSTIAKIDVVPGIFSAINRYGLLFFLAANLLTGFINILLDTLLIEFPWDLLIISTYTFVLVGIVYFIFLYNKR